jgi:SRSO17 transposase
MALEMIDELIEWGRIPPVLTADAGYGDTTAFRQGLTDREIGYVVAVKATAGSICSSPGPRIPPSWRGRVCPTISGLPPNRRRPRRGQSIDRGVFMR